MNLFKSCADGAHKFQPRYDTVAPGWMGKTSWEVRGDLSRYYEKHYVRDVCVRCGKTIEREASK